MSVQFYMFLNFRQLYTQIVWLLYLLTEVDGD
jgi:hypothetical protein